MPAALVPALITLVLARPVARAGEQDPAPAGEWQPPAAFSLGGYVTVRYRDLEEEPSRLDVRNASLFATWTPRPEWLFFTEAEIEQAVTIDRDGIDVDDAELAMERLYAEYALETRFVIRVGKFLTPIGRWNLSHADPLVWTVSRPLAASLPFAGQSTGVAVRGTLPRAGGDWFEYIAYLDDSKALDPAADEGEFEDVARPAAAKAFDNAAGGQLRWHFLDDRAEVAASFTSFEPAGPGERRHLLGLDGRLNWRGTELSSELFYSAVTGHGNKEWGAYVQAALPLIERFHGILRYERYFGDRADARVRLATIGLAYHPLSSMVFKLEYRAGDDNEAISPSGFLASWGWLF